ncbi:hypothetical protein BsWGS_17207 [Bradybaena similaris]
MTDQNGLIISILACIVVVIVNIIAAIVVAVLCRRRCRQRVRTPSVSGTEPYHVSDINVEPYTGICNEYCDANGYQIPIPPPYTYITPLAGPPLPDAPTDSQPLWAGDVGEYELEIRRNEQGGSFRKDSGDNLDQNHGKNNCGKTLPKVKLTLALYET